VDLKGLRAVALDEQQAVPSLERVKHVGHARAVRLGDARYGEVELVDDIGRSRDAGGYFGNVVLVAMMIRALGRPARSVPRIFARFAWKTVGTVTGFAPFRI
jgi:hypothetical protein